MEAVKPSPRYFENLDGLRFLAFLIVFISHVILFIGLPSANPSVQLFSHYFLVNGEVGVTFFFVLSGFLITYLLLKEKEKAGNINIKNFYSRRAKRLLPTYFLTVALGFLALPLLGNSAFPFNTIPDWSELPYFIFFIQNFRLAFGGGALLALNLLWAISIEVQFYLVWPILVNFFSKQNLLRLILSIIGVSFLYRYFYSGHPTVLAYSTFSVMSDLTMGALLGWIIFYKNELVETFKNKLQLFGAIWIYFLTFFFIILKHFILGTHSPLFPLIQALWPLVLSFLFTLIILDQNENEASSFKMGKFRKISYLGKISYSLYAYHLLILVVLVAGANKWSIMIYSSPLAWIFFVAAFFALAVLAAAISEKYLEAPLAKKKV